MKGEPVEGFEPRWDCSLRCASRLFQISPVALSFSLSSNRKSRWRDLEPSVRRPAVSASQPPSVAGRTAGL